MILILRLKTGTFLKTKTSKDNEMDRTVKLFRSDR